MFLSISTTHRPATDLGFLLMKHPDRVFDVELTFGRGTVFFPEATAERCEAVLTVDVDPVGLVRGRGSGDGLLDAYVNDRPYAASSFLSVALNKAFRTAMTGVSRDRPELALQAIPLEIRVAPLPVKEPDESVAELFEPLGWTVTTGRLPTSAGEPSRYVSLTLTGRQRVADALSHLYVLIPALDADKHYWVGEDEVDKLVAKGGAWLAGHPAREKIVSRYLRRRRGLVRDALARLAPAEAEEEAADDSKPTREDALETPIRLHDQRLEAVAEALAAAGAGVVADLGCGEGKLLRRLVRDRRFTKLIGLDACMRSLERASERMRLKEAGGPPEGRVTLLHGALTYRDERWHGADAAALVEVIEHLDADRLPALEEVVFGQARPRAVVVTTPNADHNALFESLPAGAFRHPDHRFEWTRAEFSAWASRIEERYGYAAALSGVGADHPDFGPPSQMAVFTR
jgi:3' terminal RNA ribose 2'-O-methyltransferase Hen1